MEIHGGISRVPVELEGFPSRKRIRGRPPIRGVKTITYNHRILYVTSTSVTAAVTCPIRRSSKNLRSELSILKHW